MSPRSRKERAKDLPGNLKNYLIYGRDDTKYGDYNWSLVVGCPHREWQALIKHRLIQDKRGVVVYERRDLGITWRQPEMLVLINLSLFLKIRNGEGLDLDRSLANDIRLNRSRGILNSDLTRIWIHKLIRTLTKERILLKVRPEYSIDMIFGMAVVQAKWFHSLMDRDDRRGWGASITARKSHITSQKELIPAYMMAAWEEKRVGGGRMSPLPDKRQGWSYRNGNMLMCKPTKKVLKAVKGYLARQDMYLQSQE